MQNPFASSFPSPPPDEGGQAAHLHHPRALDPDQQQQQQHQLVRLQQEQELELLHLSELDASQHHHPSQQQQQAFQLPHPVPHWSEHDDADSYSLASRTSSTGKDGGGSSNDGGGGGSVSGGTGAGGKAGGGGSSSSSSSTAAAGRTKKRNLSNPQTSRWLTCQVCRDSKTKWYVKQNFCRPFLLSFVYPFSYPTPSVVLPLFPIP